jgi:hypothetical protein
LPVEPVQESDARQEKTWQVRRDVRGTLGSGLLAAASTGFQLLKQDQNWQDQD